MRVAIGLHFVTLLLASVSFANIKTLSPKPDEIIEIKTALGIATIIQIPDVIQSAIMGDQSAYRIEYVDKAVTIKPLRGGARTNLYLFTKERRYNLRLIVVPQTNAYYIVYIRKQDLGAGPRWSSSGKTISNEDLTLKLNRIGMTQDGFILLDISATAKRFLKLQASDIWLYEGSESKVINSLFLSKTDIKKDQLASIAISVRKADLGTMPLILELKSGAKPLRIEVLRGALWK